LPNVGPYIYTTLAFLALLGAPYIYDISSLRVKGNPVQTMKAWMGNRDIAPLLLNLGTTC